MDANVNMLYIPPQTYIEYRMERYTQEPPKYLSGYYIPDEKAVNSVLAISTLAMDWAQTRNLTSDGHFEQNPIMGKYPSRNTVDAYFIISMVVHLFVNHTLDEDTGDKYNKVIKFAEGFMITHNSRLGVSMEF